MADKSLYTLADAPLPSCCAAPALIVDSSAATCTCKKCDAEHTLDSVKGWIKKTASKK